MSVSKSLVRIIGSGKTVAVKAYGFGFIDCAGNFYHRNIVQFIRVLE